MGRSASCPGTTRASRWPRRCRPRSPRRLPEPIDTNQVYTFEALLIAADAYKRAGSTVPGAGRCDPRDRHQGQRHHGPGIKFDAKGQNDKLMNSGIQNRGGKLVTVAPKGAINTKVEWPMKPYDRR